MNKKILGLAIISTLFSVNVLAEDSAKKIGFDEKDYSTYNLVEVIKSGDKSADKIFKKYHSEYLGKIKKINREMDKYKAQTGKDFDKNIAEFQKGIKEQQALFDKNCTDIKDAKTHESCEAIKENVFNITEQEKELHVEKSNFIKKIESDQKNRLKGTYYNYKNLSGKLLVDVKNQG